jgi:hypothetical protein
MVAGSEPIYICWKSFPLFRLPFFTSPEFLDVVEHMWIAQDQASKHDFVIVVKIRNGMEQIFEEKIGSRFAHSNAMFDTMIIGQHNLHSHQKMMSHKYEDLKSTMIGALAKQGLVPVGQVASTTTATTFVTMECKGNGACDDTSAGGGSSGSSIVMTALNVQENNVGDPKTA